MTEIEQIKKDIKKIENKYLSSAIEIIKDYNNENKTRDDYKGRQIFELLQNADDCYTDKCQEISVKFTLQDGKLIVQNTGSKFTSRGIVSLMYSDASSKHGDTIGCKGLGFRSVLNWSNEIDIFTEDFHVNFSESHAKELLDYYKKNTDKDYVKELDENKMERIAILNSAVVDNNKYSDFGGYSSTIVLTCFEEYLDDIQSQLEELQFEELLFLKHITKIEIVSPNVKRIIESAKVGDECYIKEGEEETTWKLWIKTGLLPQKNGEQKKYEISIAYNDDPDIREEIREEGVLYSFFKTEIRMPFPFLIHGTFELTSERNKIIKDNDNNKQLLDILIDFIAEKGLELCKNKSCSYEPLKFVLPAEGIYFLDKDYNFTNLLKQKIRFFKIFPTINNEYIDLFDAKYDDSKFSEILFPNTFSDLLQHCDDDAVKKFLYENHVTFYDATTIIDRINIDADYYVDNLLHIELIKLFCDRYANAKNAPYILTDNCGNRIKDKTKRIFNIPQNFIELPDWCEVYYLNEDVENELKAYWGCTTRILMDKLDAFGCSEYAFDKIVRELNNQSKEDLEKNLKFVNWLYKTWKQGGRNFPTDLSEIKIYLCTREKQLINSEDCYFGIEYNNKIGEEIINYIDTHYYLANPKVYDLGNEIIEMVVDFFKTLKVASFPRLNHGLLEGSENLKYLNNLFKKHQFLFVDYETYYTIDDFLQARDYKIFVGIIDNIKKILENVAFENIIYWIFNDKLLYESITTNQEIPNGFIAIRSKGKKDYEIIHHENIDSYLRMIFTDIAWFPTKSKKKVSVSDVTIGEHQLSPVVEVLDVNFEMLDKLFSRRIRKEVEVFLEKIGVASSYVNLPKEKIYEILLRLPNIDKNCLLGKKIYAELNLEYDNKECDELIKNNPNYTEFKKNGLVLAKQNGVASYMPINKVFYVGKKLYSDSILNDFPKLEMARRAGDDKMRKMFGVKPLKIEGLKINGVSIHKMNEAYQGEYKKTIPYIFINKYKIVEKNLDGELLDEVPKNTTSNYSEDSDITLTDEDLPF